MPNIVENDLSTFYLRLQKQAVALLEGEPDALANMANLAALLNMELDRINWVGFYLLREEQNLVLGPFQGNPACTRIPMGRGVCGTAAQTGVSLVVPDVHQFAGHIACDSKSNSELVIPILKQGYVYGVLDIDSPELGRFTESDRIGLEAILNAVVDWL